MGIIARTSRILSLESAKSNMVKSHVRTLSFMALLVFMFAAPASVHAQSKSDSLSLDILFRRDNPVVDPAYRGNDALFAQLDSLLSNPDIKIESIKILTSSSPEGVVEHNQWLTSMRARNIHEYIKAKYPHITLPIVEETITENWEGLRKAVLCDTIMSAQVKDKVLVIIDSDINVGTKKWRLEQLPVYRYMLSHIYPSLRHSNIRLLNMTDISVSAEPEKEEAAVVEPKPEENGQTEAIFPTPDQPTVTEPVTVATGAEEVPTTLTEEQEEVRKKTILALKTNLLYDAVTALNFEVEVPIADHFSVLVEDVFPWWETGNKYCFQMWEMGIEGRYYFRSWADRLDHKLTGLYAGVYGMSSKYDFQLDTKLCYQGEYWSAGVSAGYAIELGRKKWGILDFSASLGFLQTDYRHYYPKDDYSALIRDQFKAGTMTYFGPTKLKVGLSIPIKVRMNRHNDGGRRK